MKLLISTLMILPLTGITQTIEFIEPRTVQGFEKVDYTPIKTSTNFYMYMDQYNMKSSVNRDMQLDVYNNDLKTTSTGKIDEGSLAMDDANIYETVVALGDQLYLFKYHFVKKDTKLALNCYTLSSKSERGAAVELVKFTAEKAMNSGNFSVVASPDGSKLAILGELPAEKEMMEKCIVWVFDKDLKEIWKKEYEFPYESSKGPMNEVYVNNNGAVFIEKKVPIKKAIDIHTLFTFTEGGKDVKETKLSMATDAILSSYKTSCDKEGNLIMAGFYYIDKKVGVNVETPDGPFYVKVNAKDGSIAVQMANKSALIQNLRTVSMTLLEDNSVILTGEQVYEKSEPKNPGTTVIEYNYTYNNMAILAIKLNSDGTIAWEHRIDRDIKSMNDNGKLNSVFAMVNGDKIRLIYRDLLYKHDGVEDKGVIGPPLSSMYADIVTTLDMDGKVISDTYITDQRIGGKSGEYYLIPTSGYKIDDNTLWMLGTRSMELVSVKIKF